MIKVGIGVDAPKAQGEAAPATVPVQFTNTNWNVVDKGTGTEVTLTINSLPFDGGSPLTSLEYRIDAGSWVQLTASPSTGTYNISGLTVDVEVTFTLRAVNAIGNGTESAGKAVTPTLAPTVPAAFGTSDWSLLNAGTGGTLTVSITTLASDGGSALTRIDYRIGSGVWTTLTNSPATGTYDITGLVDDTVYSISLRASNAVGDGAASIAKEQTPTAATPPVISGSIANQTTDRGETISTISLSSVVTGDADSYTLNVSSDDLPSGVSLDTSTGDITGTTLGVNNPGFPFNISIDVSGPGGAAAGTIDFTWDVSQIETSSFEVTATGVTLLTGNSTGDIYVGVEVGSTPTEAAVIAQTTTYAYTAEVTGSGATAEFDLTSEVGNSVTFGLVQVADTPAGKRSAFLIFTEVLQASKPAVFSSAMWSVTTGSGDKELDIAIASLPGNGGSAITDLEYDVDGNNTWTSLGAAVTGTYTITLPASGTSYGIRLRAVNANGNANAGNTESATSGTASVTASLAAVNAVALPNANNTNPRTVSFTANDIQNLSGDALVGIGQIVSNPGTPGSVTIGGVAATQVGTGSGGGAIRARTTWWFASGTFTTDDVAFTPSGGNTGDAAVVLYDSVGLDWDNAKGSVRNRDGGGAANQDFTTTSVSGDFAAAIWAIEGTSGTNTIDGTDTAHPNAGPIVTDNRRVLSGYSSSSVGANHTFETTISSSGDASGEVIVGTPLA